VRETWDRIKVLLDEVSVYDMWALLIDLKERLKNRDGEQNWQHLGIVQRRIQKIKDLILTGAVGDGWEGFWTVDEEMYRGPGDWLRWTRNSGHTTRPDALRRWQNGHGGGRKDIPSALPWVQSDDSLTYVHTFKLFTEWSISVDMLRNSIGSVYSAVEASVNNASGTPARHNLKACKDAVLSTLRSGWYTSFFTTFAKRDYELMVDRLWNNQFFRSPECIDASSKKAFLVCVKNELHSFFGFTIIT
jgi:hypothetical protein